MRLLVLPLSKALHAALLLSIQEEMGTCEGRLVSRGAKLRVSGCILPRELRWLSRRIWTVKGPMTREGTCQSLQSRALSLDVDSKQWLYLLSEPVWTKFYITMVSPGARKLRNFEHYPRKQSSWGQHGANLGPIGPKWAPCWPHEPCYQGMVMRQWYFYQYLIVAAMVNSLW